MQLYHFTSIYHLRGIAKYGLTVGDVPTDMDAVKGIVGVWLTTSPTPEGHGLSGSKADKTRFRLTVDVPEDRLLHKWTAWARSNVPARTLQMLATPRDRHRVLPHIGGRKPTSLIIRSILTHWLSAHRRMTSPAPPPATDPAACSLLVEQQGTPRRCRRRAAVQPRSRGPSAALRH